jgi:hypothetical protein
MGRMLPHLRAGRHARVQRFTRAEVVRGNRRRPSLHEIALIPGDILRAACHRDDADGVFQRALGLFRQKGSIVGVRIAAARLAG